MTPVGLLGELIINAFVLGVMASYIFLRIRLEGFPVFFNDDRFAAVVVYVKGIRRNRGRVL